MMLIQQVAPPLVAESRVPLRRAGNVGEEHGGQKPVRMRCRPDTGEKLLDLIDNCVLVADPGEVVLTGKLDELCAGDPGGDVATLLDVRVQIAAPMKNKGRDPDDRQDVPHID